MLLLLSDKRTKKMENLDQILDMPEMAQILEILKNAESLEDRSDQLKREAAQLRRKRKAEEIIELELYKKPYHFHEKNIEEFCANLTDQQHKNVMRMSRECFDELNDM